MTDAILVALGDLPQAVIGVIRGAGDPTAFADQEGIAFIVPSNPPVCAGQLWDGETATDPPPPEPGPEPVPYRISRMQFRAYLAGEDLLSTWDAFVSDSPMLTPMQREIVREASHYHRDHELTPAIGAALGMDGGDLDEMWIAAAKIS